MRKETRIGIIGCGLIGFKRAHAFTKLKNNKIVSCYDTNNKVKKNFSHIFKCNPKLSLNELITSDNLDAVLVATPHNKLAEITLLAIKNNKHVMVEKPGAINYRDLLNIEKISHKKKRIVHIGFNHRYHRTLLKAQELFYKNKIGEVMFVRGRYGHGGRPGYEKEWRFNQKISGGGELIDQGPHLIDLSYIFLGELKKNYLKKQALFWNITSDDNAFMVLENKKKKTSFLHVSCSEWKNMFSLEIYGKKGKISIEGLGGSYGTEIITFYKMSKKMGPPLTYKWEYPMPDNSWEIECRHFLSSLKNKKQDNTLKSAINILKIIYK